MNEEGKFVEPRKVRVASAGVADLEEFEAKEEGSYWQG